MHDKKKEIYIWEDLWGVGGIETLLLNFMSTINNKYKFILVLVNKTTNMFDDRLKELGVEVYILLDEIIENPVKRFVKGLSAFRVLLMQREIETIHFQVSHSIDFLYIEIAKLQGVPNRISHCQNGEVNSILKRFAHSVLKPFVQEAPTIRIGVSNKAARWVYSKKYSREWIIMYNAIYLDQFIFDENERKLCRDKLDIAEEPVYLHVGRFNAQKNHAKLISVFNEIVKRQPRAILLLLGDGEKKEEIKALVNKFGIERNVRFIGNEKNVKSYYCAADELIFPSNYEGLSLVLVEAQASSLPCVVSDTCDDANKFLECATFMPLKEADLKWAMKCISLCGRSKVYSYDDMKDSMYEIRNYAKKMGKIYESLIKWSD